MRAPPETCPNCGAEVPPQAQACPQCGSDYETGWNERAQEQNLGLPDSEFDYDRYVQEEFRSKERERGLAWYWWVAAAMVLVGFLMFLF